MRVMGSAGERGGSGGNRMREFYTISLDGGRIVGTASLFQGIASFVMKNLIAHTFAAALLAAPALAASGWHTNFAAAQKLAVEEKKDLLIDFTGSDWCSWCKKLKKEVFDHAAFGEGVKDKFILVELDYPSDKSILDEATIKQNAALKTEFAISGYPTIMLCDAKGRPYAQTGYQKGGPEAYLKHLDEKRKSRALRDEAFAKASKAQGEGRAGFLEEALKVVPEGTLATLYKKEFDELKALNGKSDLVTTVNSATALRTRRETFRTFFTGKDYEGALKHVDSVIAKDKLEGEEKQQLLYYKLNAYMAMGSHDDALKVAEEITRIEPESRFGKGAARLGEHFKRIEARKAEEQKNESDAATPCEGGAEKTSSSIQGKIGFLVIAQEDAEEAQAGKKEKAKAPSEAELKKGLAKTSKELEAVRKKINVDHELWENSEEETEVTKARIAELEAALNNERARLKKLVDLVARIEREHNADHDREELLRKQLADRKKALAEFDSKQDVITKLEKQAAELRRQAEKLRKRAEELRKN